MSQKGGKTPQKLPAGQRRGTLLERARESNGSGRTDEQVSASAVPDSGIGPDPESAQVRNQSRVAGPAPGYTSPLTTEVRSSTPPCPTHSLLV